jgi:hypothetical protein
MYSPLVYLVNRVHNSPMFLSLSLSPHIIPVTTGHVKSEKTPTWFNQYERKISNFTLTCILWGAV